MSTHAHIYIYIYTYIHILTLKDAVFTDALMPSAAELRCPDSQDSSKGDAVETGCSDSYDVIH